MIGAITKFFLEKIWGFITHWKSKKGFMIVSLVMPLSFGLFSLQFSYSPLYFALSVICFYLFWIPFWFVKSGRSILPSQYKKTIVFCFDVDSEGQRIFNKVLRRIRCHIEDLNLEKKVRLINISSDIIISQPKAHKYREKNKVDLIVWGNMDYGSLDSQKVLQFDVRHTITITPSLNHNLNLFLVDVGLILAKKDWTIREVNELKEFKVVADNLFEIALFIIGIYFYDENSIVNATKIFESILPFFVEKEKNMITIVHSVQAGRIRALLSELYFLQAIGLHNDGRIEESIKYLEKIPEHVPNRIPVLMMLARTNYLIGDVVSAKRYTDDIRKIDRRHPAVCLNLAFFGILQRNYDRVKFWYDELIKHKMLKDIDNLNPVITFLDDEYNKNPNEHAYLYALGIVNGYIDPLKRKSELKRFIRRVKNLREYQVLLKRAKELI